MLSICFCEIYIEYRLMYRKVLIQLRPTKVIRLTLKFKIEIQHVYKTIIIKDIFKAKQGTVDRK